MFTLLDSLILMSNRKETINPNMVIYSNKMGKIKSYQPKLWGKYPFNQKEGGCSLTQNRTGI